MKKTDEESKAITDLSDLDEKLMVAGKSIGTLFDGLEISDPLNMELFGIIWALTEIYSNWFPSKKGDALIDELFKPIFRNESPKPSLPEPPSKHDYFKLVRTVESCVHALKWGNTANLKRRDRAWGFLLSAFVGYMDLTRMEKPSEFSPIEKPSELSEFSRKGAKARHAENRAMKEEFLNWYAENKDKYPSMDAAAEYAAGKVVPVKFRTARGWLSKPRNKQSPGKA